MRNEKFTAKLSAIGLSVLALAIAACSPTVTPTEKKSKGNDVQAPIVPLNDTGVTDYSAYQDFGPGPIVEGQKPVLYSKSTVPNSAPPGQDADFGLDVTNPNPNTGKGFHFRKLVGQNRQVVPVPDADSSNPAKFDCVEDEVTGLTWENKNDDPSSIHFAPNLYLWYNSDPDSNGGDPGTKDPGQCTGIAGNTEDFIKQVNANKLCGYTDWRLPLVEELRSLIDYSGQAPNMVDPVYFPYVTQQHHRWTAETYIQDNSKAWGFHMHEGQVQEHSKRCKLLPSPSGSAQNYFNGIMLVRGNPRPGT